MNHELPIFSDGWQTAKLRRKLRGIDGIRIGPFGSTLTLDQMVADGYKVYGQENVISDDFTAGSRYITPNKYAELKACSITSGDLLVTMMGTTGRCCVVPDGIQVGIMDSHLIRLRFQKEVDPDYMALLIDKGHYIREQIGAAGKGTIMSGLNSAIIKDVRIGLPDLQTQRHLVRYIDEQTGKIDRLMDMRRRQMALLKEQRAALIQEAVTRGLNPNVPMKDSGLPWLGQIPAHWRIVKLKYLCSHIVDCLHSTPNYAPDGNYPAIRTADVVPGYINTDGAKRLSHDNYLIQIQRLAPEEGDIVYSREGERFGIAAPVPAGVELCVSQRMMHFRVRRDVNSQFVMWQLNTKPVYSQALVRVFGATSPHINVETITNYILVEPTLEEQSEIVTFIDTQIAKFDALHTAYAHQLTLLTEYRAALIHECVTGQRIVPEADYA